jgi:importin subunit alpha-1
LEILFIIFLFSQNNKYSIQILIDEKVLPALVTIYEKYNQNEKICLYIYKVIGNLLSGTDIQTELLIQNGILEILRNFIEEKDPKKLKEILWSCSNIAAGTCSQIERLYSSGIIFRTMEIIDTYKEVVLYDKVIQKTIEEASYVLVNTIGGSLSGLRVNLLGTKYNLPEMLVNVLNWYEANPKLINLTLTAIEKILDLDDDQQMIDISIQNSFIKYGLYEQLSKLLNYKDSDIAHHAGKILDQITENHNNI